MKKLEALTGQISGMSNLADTPMTEPEFDTTDSGYVSDEAVDIEMRIREANSSTPRQRA